MVFNFDAPTTFAHIRMRAGQGPRTRASPRGQSCLRGGEHRKARAASHGRHHTRRVRRVCPNPQTSQPPVDGRALQSSTAQELSRPPPAWPLVVGRDVGRPAAAEAAAAGGWAAAAAGAVGDRTPPRACPPDTAPRSSRLPTQRAACAQQREPPPPPPSAPPLRTTPRRGGVATHAMPPSAPCASRRCRGGCNAGRRW